MLQTFDFFFELTLKKNKSKALLNYNIFRPDCVALVDAFDFPDYALNSTIGRYIILKNK